MKRFAILTLFLLGLYPGSAEAVRRFTVVQTNPAPPAYFIMGTTQSVTFTVTNTSRGRNIGERIYEVRFRINTGTTFSRATAAPPGWSITAYGGNSITFQANSWWNAIPSGSSVPFTLVLLLRKASADVAETLRDVRAGFTRDTNFNNGIRRTGRVRINRPGRWNLKSLEMTLVPSTYNVGTGCQFTLTMTITNRSTAKITGVTSQPKPPTRTGVNAYTSSTPPDLSLSPGATGTMVWTYTAGATPGTLTFTAYARDVRGRRTSLSVTTPPITVSSGPSCAFTSTIAVTPDCLFSGDTATFTMTVTNTTGSTLTNIVPSALTRFGTAVIGAFSGPVPSSIPSLANNSSGQFTWTATVTGNIDDTYWVTGYARATGPIQTATATSNTQDIDGYTVSITPPATNAGSTNQDIKWTITNYGCGNINQVAISPPAGWAPSSDGYAVVTNTTGTQVDTWTLAGTTFTSPNATDRMPLSQSGEFSLLFSATPPGAGNYTFNITITDDQAVPLVKTVQTTITVNPFNTGGLNATNTGVWQEEVK